MKILLIIPLVLLPVASMAQRKNITPAYVWKFPAHTNTKDVVVFDKQHKYLVPDPLNDTTFIYQTTPGKFDYMDERGDTHQLKGYRTDSVYTIKGILKVKTVRYDAFVNGNAFQVDNKNVFAFLADN